MSAALIAMALVAWACVLAANPGRPAGVSDEALRVWSRHHGARERLVVLALALTILAFVSLIISLSSAATMDGTVPACSEQEATRGMC